MEERVAAGARGEMRGGLAVCPARRAQRLLVSARSRAVAEQHLSVCCMPGSGDAAERQGEARAVGRGGHDGREREQVIALRARAVTHIRLVEWARTSALILTHM